MSYTHSVFKYFLFNTYPLAHFEDFTILNSEYFQIKYKYIPEMIYLIIENLANILFSVS